MVVWRTAVAYGTHFAASSLELLPITMVFVMIYFGSGNASFNIKQRIKIGITFSWIWALSWALMPIFGWSSSVKL
ncbi:hypothetical protein Avbf_17375 [Armadillidium vulgare]|nr:hypothetical protein Avbf_17375 [Armadillidium vulgare]